MAATGKTPILLYGSTTATNAPVAGNLTNSSDGCEIAINVADKNLFFKDATNVVNTVPIRQSSASSNGWLSSTDWSTFNGKVSSQWVTSGSDIYYNTGSVGVNCTPTTIANYRTVELRGATTGTGGIVRLSNSDNSQASWWYSYNTAAWFGNYTNIPLLMGVNNAETFRLDTSGNAKINNGNLIIGTSGKGIDFSVTPDATATSELLADYEEGTWTPVLTFGGAAVGMTGTFTGNYTKVGNMVTIWGKVVLTAKGSSTGNALITGLPYTKAADPAHSSNVFDPIIAMAGLTSGGCIFSVVSGTTLYPMVQTTTSRVQITATNFTDTSQISFSSTYKV